MSRCLSIVEAGLVGLIDIVVKDRSDSVDNCILAMNYPSNFTEYLLIPMYLRSKGVKFTILTGKVAGKWARMFLGSDAVIALDAERGNYEAVKTAIANKLDEGYTVIVYPERNFAQRSSDGQIVKLRSGVFLIAEELQTKLVLGAVSPIQHVAGFVRSPQTDIVIENATSFDPAAIANHMQGMLDKTSSL